MPVLKVQKDRFLFAS